MIRISTLTFSIAAFAALAGCVEDTGSAISSTAPSPAEQACLRDVTGATNNPDVVLLSSSFSEAGTQVIVGVGEQKARWSCIAYSDGTTAGIESQSDEGSL